MYSIFILILCNVCRFDKCTVYPGTVKDYLNIEYWLIDCIT
jgi:hypothetical protein